MHLRYALVIHSTHTLNPLSVSYMAMQLRTADVYAFICKESVRSTNNPQPCLDPPKSEWHDGQRQLNEAVKYSLLNDIKRWRSCSGVPRGCGNKIRLWPHFGG